MAKTSRSPRNKRTTTRKGSTRTRTRAAVHAKKKQVVKPASSRGVLRRDALGFALKAMLKKKGGRTDIEIQDAPKSHHSLMTEVPLHERAGYPLVRDKGSVDPATWRSLDGKEIIVDFSRHAWLPDTWGQGVKSTKPKSFKKTNTGGTYTVMVSPEGKVFYHRKAAEEFYGQPFSLELGFNGQVRTAKLQGQEAIQVARASIKDINAKGEIKTDADSMLFGLLKPSEKKFLVSKNKFHFCIISARRATQASGIRDLFMIQSQFVEAGVEPVWYVDEQSLKDYKKLGLNAVVGGKLTPARNKALQDAQKMGKICVQASDDISAWEYRVGKKATDRSDDACNEAYEAAKRLILSPVAAAQFILAKMRGSEEKPKLGGVYMLGSCARTFFGDEFMSKHFILGDFFVVDVDNKVRFDEEMTLKEDYDFTASHIKEYGSVLRCQRMTLRVKHYDNSGGACTNRDGKGKEEQKNIAILKRKWPRAIRDHHTRKNEVILSWPSNNDAEGLETPLPRSRPQKSERKSRKKVMKVAMKRTRSSKPRAVRKSAKTVDRVELPCSPNAKMVVTGKVAKCAGINARLKKVNGKRVYEVVGKVQYKSPKGPRMYNCSDLRYDQTFGYLTLKAR
mmetsp:Transcript_87266/g.138450  ORF Transcript_87266/g.138450 Transcript_87266/m.138450 type:complete len:620 (+) Transcript_87266:81-1940(+)